MLDAAAATAFAAAGNYSGALGALAGGAWLFLNLLLLARLMEMAIDVKSRGKKDKILVLSVLKFPVLYLTGFFILKSRIFPVTGILAGLTAVIAAFAFQWLRSSQIEKSIGGTA